jgi:ABC-2 type transport system permease protein
MNLDLSNVRAIARREYLARFRTRTFRMVTVLLVVLALGVALAPVLIRYLDQRGGPTTIEVSVGDSKPSVDVVTALGGILNVAATDATGSGASTGGSTGSGGATGSGSGSGAAATPKYRVVAATDPAAARERVRSGASAGLLELSRTASGELAFNYLTSASIVDRLPQIVRQAAISIVIQDRLTKAGIPPLDQVRLFAPPTFALEPVDPSRAGQQTSAESYINGFTVGFVLAIVLFMAIIMYGQWIAYSVAEEKSSRVMEVILGAATPFQLLAGKVLGVGALALTQYAIVFVPAVVALLFQDKIAALILGGEGSVALPAGISIGLLAAFGLFFLLGFSLYAMLYAGAAALVSRTEDINQIIAPLTLLSTAGYLVATYSSTGLIASDSVLVKVLSFVPFSSPYLMLSRIGAGTTTVPEVVLAIAILAVSVPVALWVAARLYAGGVLMYGQRPSIRLLFRVLRSA